MHEIACPTCNSPSSYDFRNYILMCPYCYSSFKFDPETGLKEVFQEHFIIPNASDAVAIKGTVADWLKRLHHRPGSAQHEYFVTGISGIALPFWIVSLEGHTVWKGLVRRQNRNLLETHPGADYMTESGQFRRSYRWAVSARHNLCEIWGMIRLHEPQEKIKVEWDGFPLDSTFSRGRLTVPDSGGERSIYEARELYDSKFLNGITVGGIQVNEDEALRRAKLHVDMYHHRLSCLNVDYLVDIRTEFDIAGIQMIHLPFWQAKYVYRPVNAMRYFYRPIEKNVLLDGFGKGILKGELAVVRKDKVNINAAVSAFASVMLIFFGFTWHPAFFFVGAFAAAIAGVSYLKNQANQDEVPGEKLEISTSLAATQKQLPTAKAMHSN